MSQKIIEAAPGFYVLDIEIQNDGNHFINYLPVTGWQLETLDLNAGAMTKPLTIMGIASHNPAILSPNGMVNVGIYSFKDIDAWAQWEIDMALIRSGAKEQDWGAVK